MTAKEVTVSDDARRRMRKGRNTLAKAVRAALGPKGRNAVIKRAHGVPTITKVS